MTDEAKQLLKQIYSQQVRDEVSNSDIDVLSFDNDINEQIYKINETIIKREAFQKEHLRDKLTSTVTHFIWIQLIFFNTIVLLIVLSVTVKVGIFKNINNDLATLLFDFLKYYISVTIAELLGMLVFILHYVFSKYSGTELISNIKSKLTKE